MIKDNKDVKVPGKGPRARIGARRCVSARARVKKVRTWMLEKIQAESSWTSSERSNLEKKKSEWQKGTEGVRGSWLKKVRRADVGWAG